MESAIAECRGQLFYISLGVLAHKLLGWGKVVGLKEF